ncbi:MAG: helicase-exonuclease AddAB subunit AddA [Firmicutes bacterium]|nr:helicase-exonuclease AddAB subunit AddA [Bacillota bacterium]
MKWTEKQAEAIESRGSSLLVSAAAGSGKTAVLIERVKKLVIEDGVGLDHMLIVTFTRAAASEMRSRLYEALSRELAECRDRERASTLRRQFSLVSSADICTFNSFALSVVRRYYHVIGVSPGLSIADEARTGILLEEAMDELFSEGFASGDGDLTAFLDSYAGSRDDAAARNMIRAFRDFLQSMPYPREWAEKSCLGGYDAEALLGFAASVCASYLRSAAAGYRRAEELILSVPELFPGMEAAEDFASQYAQDAAVMEDLAQLYARGEYEALLEGARGIKLQRKAVRGAKEKASAEPVKAEVDLIKDHVKDSCIEPMKKFAADISGEALKKEGDLLAPHLARLCRLTLELDERYAAKKARAGVMDFSDAEHFAIRILENEQVREEYRRQYSCVFIDEYQDSNRVQETIIERVGRPDNVFMVGDVKQSIYRFRLAEPEIFSAKYLSFKEDPSKGRVIDLNSNFRSKPRVIDLVNGVFSQIMTSSVSDIEYDDAAALHAGLPEEDPVYPPELRIIDRKLPEGAEPDEAIEDMGAAALGAQQAVSVIKEYRGKPFFDSRLGRLRPLEYSDMAILLPVMSGLGEEYYSALERAGIPVFLNRSEGYFDVPEVRICLDMLRLVNNGRQDLPLISVLHFPVFGFSEAELAGIRIYADRAKPQERLSYSEAFDLYADEGSDPALAERCRAFLEKIEDWRYRASFSSVSALLELMINETGIDDYAAALPGGRQRIANVRALLDKAAAYESEELGGIYGFISYIEAIKDKVRVGEVRVFSEKDDAVRIMTIHGSKGLEFPFVLLSGLERRLYSGGPLRVDAAFHKDLGVGIKLIDRDRHIEFKPAVMRMIEAKKREEELAEKIRLLYVAMTRARDVLVMSAVVKDYEKFKASMAGRSPSEQFSAATYLDLLYPALGGVKKTLRNASDAALQRAGSVAEAAELARVLSEGLGAKAEVPSDRAAEIAERIRYERELPAEENRKYSVSQLAELEKRGAGAISVPEYSFAMPRFMDRERRLSGAEKGTAYHSVMEHLPFEDGLRGDEYIASFIEQLRKKNVLSDAEAAAVEPSRISAFFRSDIGRRALDSPELRKEAPFTYRSERDGREVLIQGTIDCFFREEDGWVLVDYKSNYIDYDDVDAALEKLRASYLPQLALYKKALEDITGHPVKEAVLYLFSLGRELVIEA